MLVSSILQWFTSDMCQAATFAQKLLIELDIRKQDFASELASPATMLESLRSLAKKLDAGGMFLS
jgi:hypothetical protein